MSAWIKSLNAGYDYIQQFRLWDLMLKQDKILPVQPRVTQITAALCRSFGDNIGIHTCTVFLS